MLTLSEIEKNYPENLRGFKRFILREYLQHKLLQILFDSEYANELCFLGGTCKRTLFPVNSKLEFLLHRFVFQIFYPLNGSLQFWNDFRSPFVDKAAVQVLNFYSTFQQRV